MPTSSAATSATETFVALKAHVDNWRWKGVPFYLRTGKRLPERDTEIFIQFKPRAALDLRRARGAGPQPNRLVIGLQPEENIRLLLMAKTPGLDRDGHPPARSAARHRPGQRLRRPPAADRL